MKKINWGALKVTDLEKIKLLIGELLGLIDLTTQGLKQIGVKPLCPIDTTSYRFSLLLADYKKTLELGQQAENAYYALLVVPPIHSK